MQIHASCVAREADGVRAALLLAGPSGSGKSDMALRLIGLGFTLVADDRVDIADGVASAPEPLAGLLEVRGLGLVRMPFWRDATLALLVRLQKGAERLPTPQRDETLGLPLVLIDPEAPSAAERARLALECAMQAGRCQVGAFA